MAQYKVPQDVEADDKLLGPFSFRQFVYLMVAAGLGFVAFLLFQIFPLLVIIPIPFIIFLFILALPLKKDQPMETYLSAVVDFYLKPQKRIWTPGQSDTTITITAPKNIDDNRTKDLSQEEASHRLSFLANIVDTEGYAIKEGVANSNLRDDIASEAANTQDIFEANQNFTLDHSLEQSTAARRAQVVEQMRSAIQASSTIAGQATPPQITHSPQMAPAAPAPAAPVAPVQAAPVAPTTQTAPIMPTTQAIPTARATTTPIFQAAKPNPAPATPVDISASAATIQPDMDEIHEAIASAKNPTDIEDETQSDTTEAPIVNESAPDPTPPPISIPKYTPEPAAPPEPVAANPAEPQPKAGPDTDLNNLANNTDYSIETIAKQAHRIKEKKSNDNEVYISLH